MILFKFLTIITIGISYAIPIEEIVEEITPSKTLVQETLNENENKNAEQVLAFVASQVSKSTLAELDHNTLEEMLHLLRQYKEKYLLSDAADVDKPRDELGSTRPVGLLNQNEEAIASNPAISVEPSNELATSRPVDLVIQNDKKESSKPVDIAEQEETKEASASIPDDSSVVNHDTLKDTGNKNIITAAMGETVIDENSELVKNAEENTDNENDQVEIKATTERIVNPASLAGNDAISSFSTTTTTTSKPITPENDNNAAFLGVLSQMAGNFLGVSKDEVLESIKQSLNENRPNENPFIPLISSAVDYTKQIAPVRRPQTTNHRRSSLSTVGSNYLTRGTCKFLNDNNINVEIEFIQRGSNAIPVVTKTKPKGLANAEEQLVQCIDMSSDQLQKQNVFQFPVNANRQGTIIHSKITNQSQKGSGIISDYEPIKEISEPKKPVNPLSYLDKIHERLVESEQIHERLVESEQDRSKPKYLRLKRIADKMKRNPVIRNRYSTALRTPSLEDAKELKLLVESYILLLQE